MTTESAAALQERLMGELGPWIERAERGLERVCASWDAPPRLAEGMSYAVLGAGKRVRPALTLATCAALGGAPAAAEPAALALELIHAYSLVHDDLPALDDDDERRGRPSTHKAFGEAMGVLIGDALQTEAFALVAGGRVDSRPPLVRALSVAALARAAGAAGMVGGQVLDMLALAKDVPSLRDMHGMKTGALFVAAVELGAIAAGASEEVFAALHDYGAAVGLAFQLSDDLLDLEEARQAGRHEEEVNLALLLGEEPARVMVREDVRLALDALQRAGITAGPLELLARWIEARSEATREP